MGVGSSKEEEKPVLPVSTSNVSQSGKPLEQVVVQSGGRKKTYRKGRKGNRKSQRKNRRCGY